mgnify:FL=1
MKKKRNKILLKKGLALFLAMLMAGSVEVNTGFSYIYAQEIQAPLEAGAEQANIEETNTGIQYQILDFVELSKKVNEQTLQLGAKEKDIVLPESLDVTVRESVAGEDSAIAGSEEKQLTLSGIEWKLNSEESDFSKFKGNKDGSVYVYNPVLPETDEEGNTYVLSEQAQLPAIYVLVGEMQTALLSSGQTFSLDSLPVDSQYEFVIDSGNQSTYNNAILTGSFSDFEDANGKSKKSCEKGIVIKGTTVNLTIRDLSVNRSESSDNKLEATLAAITLTDNATLNLTLEGDNYLKGATGGAGICVKAGSTLRITKGSSGRLKAVGGNFYGGAAGIGANGDGKIGNQPGTPQSVGNIIINGGTIEAIGGTYTMYGYLYTSAAGIGGSFEGTDGNIEINGGNVTAVSGENAAAIGGGMAGWVSSIAITGGTVTATVKGKGAAIGAGYLGQETGDLSCGNIKISGGNITTEGNIGYGDVFNENSSKAGSVEVAEDVILKCNGEINPTPENVAQYTILFQIHDGRFVQNTTGDITIDGFETARKATVTVATPGMAEIKAKFKSKPLRGKKHFEIQIDGRTYVADVNFTDGKTQYEFVVGTPLYPVILEFYDITLTQDVTVDRIVMKQGGKELGAESYYAPDKISMVSQHYGTMTVYLPEGNANTDISVIVSGLNEGKAITQTGQSISASGENRVRMQNPGELLVTADIVSVANAQAKLKVTLNYADAMLWYLQGDAAKPEKQTVMNQGTKVSVSGTTREITVDCQNSQTYYFYILAQLGDTVSEVVEVSFSSSPSAEVVLEGETQGNLYESFAQALAKAEENPGSTVKLLQDISISDTITIGSQASYTIDLNGKTLTAVYNDELYKTIFSLQRDASVNILDGAGGGKFDGDCKYPNVQKLFNLVYDANLVIQNGTFLEKAGTINGTAGNLRIKSGTFYNEVNVGYFKHVVTGGKFIGELTSGSNVGNILGRGYRYRNLTTGEAVSAESTLVESIKNVEVYVLPSIGGTVTLSGSSVWDETLTATYAPAAGQSAEEKYLYTWYYEDENGQVTKINGTVQDAQPTTSLTSNCRVPADAANNWIYCKVEAEGNNYSGSINSEKIKALPKNIENSVTHGLIKKYYTGQPVAVTQEDLTSRYFRYKGGYYLNLGSEIEIVPDSYRNNTEISTAESKASVTIRGIGAYTGEYVLKYEIIQKDITVEAEASTKEWTNQKVIISAPEGYTICPAKDGSYDYADGFDQSFAVEEGSSSIDGSVISYRLKDASDGAVSLEKTLTVKIDKDAPDFSGEQDGITINTKNWKELLKAITFGYYTKTADATIKASDALSGVSTYYYYVDTAANKDTYQVLTKDTLDSYVKENKFTEAVNGKVGMDRDGNQVLYAYAVDIAGNQSQYICSDGVVIDNETATPVVKLPSKENGTLTDTDATIQTTLDETAAVLYFYVSEGEFASRAEYEAFVTDIKNYMKDEYVDDTAAGTGNCPPFAIKENDVWKPNVPEGKTSGDHLVTGREYRTVYRIEGQEGENTFDIAGFKPGKECMLWLAAFDQAGNMSQVVEKSFTTPKAMPKIDTLPEVSGVYGDTAKDLKVTKDGVAKYGKEVVSGDWKVTDTGETLLQIGGTTTCQVTFTPDVTIYGDTYESVIVNVVPVIAKRPLTIQVSDMTVSYGTDLPQIEFAIAADSGLAGSDTQEMIASTLSLKTEAAKNSDVGDYDFTVISDSSNYEVTALYYESLADTGNGKEKGTLHITQAQGQLIKGTDYEDIHNVQYRNAGEYATFSLGVSANHSETALQYGVTKAENGNGIAIADADVAEKLLAISADGEVTLKGAGSAEITITLPETKNYTGGDSLKVRVNIAKDNVVIPKISKSFYYTVGGQGVYNMISENSLNAKRLGAITYGDGGSNENAISGMTIAINEKTVTNDVANAEFFETLPYEQKEEILYKIAEQATYEQKTATVTIPVTSENCTINDGNGLVFSLEIVKPKTVQLAEGTKVEADGTLTYGEKLSALGFKEIAFYEEGTDTVVLGTMKWKEPNTMPKAGVYQAEYIFTPEDAIAYKGISGIVTVVVNQADMPPHTPETQMTVDSSCNTLADVSLPQGWEWVDKNQTLESGVAKTAEAIYTVADKDNYKTTKISISVVRSSKEDTNKGQPETTEGTTESKPQTTESKPQTTESKPQTTESKPQTTESKPQTTESKPQKTEDKNETTESKAKSTESKTKTAESKNVTTESKTKSTDNKKQTVKNNRSTENATKESNVQNKNPFIKGGNEKGDWKHITEQIKEANEGKTVQVDMNGTTTVPGEIFNSIKGRDVTVIFDMGGGILWTVNGKTVTTQNAEDIDLGVVTGDDAGKTIPVEVINNITGERYYMNLSLSYDGEFGFTAILTLQVDAKNAGLYANLFYYNPQSEQLDYMCAGMIDEEGKVELTFTHASDYTIVIDTEPMNSQKQGDDMQTHKGNPIWIWGIMIAVILAAAGLLAFVMAGKKRNK